MPKDVHAVPDRRIPLDEVDVWRLPGLRGLPGRVVGGQVHLQGLVTKTNGKSDETGKEHQEQDEKGQPREETSVSIRIHRGQFTSILIGFWYPRFDMHRSLWLAVLLTTAVLAGPAPAETPTPSELLALTKLHNEKGDYEKSVDYGERAVEALPGSSEAHLAYAIALKIKLNQISRMKGMLVIGSYKSALRKALELDPQSVDARVEQIGFFIHAPGVIGGSETKAQEKIDSLKSTHWQEAMFMQAELHHEQEQTEAALEIYRKMIERDPAAPRARQALAFALQSDGNYREADRHFGVLLGMDDAERSMMARYQLARSRILGKYELPKAVEYLLGYLEQFSASIRNLPSESSAYWRLGLAYEQLGRTTEARTALERAVALDGDNKQARDSLKKLKRG